MAKAAPVVELTPEQVTAIQEWNASKTGLDAAKTSELANRLIVIEKVPFSPDKEEGGQTLKLNAGWKLALDRPMNYSVDKDVAKVNAAIKQLWELNPAAVVDLIRWEAVLSVGAFKKLTDEEKLILASIITMKPGTPSLDLKPPPVPKG